jgi:hypothetical protein
VLASDNNNDGVGEGVISEQRVRLDRGAPLSLKLPPRQGVVLTVTPITVEPENFDRPDPAISSGTVELVYGDHLVVNVYNNGRQPVTDVLVRVRDAHSGEIVINGEKRTGPIEAPLDLQPRFKMVEFKNVNGWVWDRLIVELDPDGAADDFNRHNNRVELDCQATFRLHHGWR